MQPYTGERVANRARTNPVVQSPIPCCGHVPWHQFYSQLSSIAKRPNRCTMSRRQRTSCTALLNANFQQPSAERGRDAISLSAITATLSLLAKSGKKNCKRYTVYYQWIKASLAGCPLQPAHYIIMYSVMHGTNDCA
jgi:hypothetical protein